MFTCKVCGREYGEAESRCPACGAPRTVAETAKPKPQDAVGDLLRYADLMDDETLFYAAICRKEGIGLEKDVPQARELFHLLALRGNYDGMYQYACLCLADVFSAKAGLHWLGVAAEKGHLSSRLKLLELAQEGKVSVSGGVAAEDAFIFADSAPAAPSENETAFRSLVKRSLQNVAAVFSSHGETRSLGAGFLLADGHFITNAHVVGEKPTAVSVRFEPALDPRIYEMAVLGNFPEYDVAVLAFKGAAAEKFKDRGFRLRVKGVEFGEQVYTIGNPLGLGLSVSKGIVSSPARETRYTSAVSEVIQTDITVNHGNSGGALLDAENRVLGMVTFVPSASDGGIAMCVPSRYIVEALNKI